MNHLIYTEWLKIKKYKAFWWLLGITALTYPGINYIFYNIYDELMHNESKAAQVAKMVIGSPFAFPEVWHTVAYGSSMFTFIPAVLVIMFITNEYTYKTHRQNVIDGWSRTQFLTSKMINVFITSLVITALYILVTLVIGLVNSEDQTGEVFDGLKYAGLFALQTFAQLSIAFLVGFLVRKAFISLGIFIFYFLILEPIAVAFGRVKLNDSLRFLPLEISDRIVPIPAFIGRFNTAAYQRAIDAINLHVLLTIVVTSLIWWLCFWINSKRDL
jgi:ABC-type transport system involved in multi-copper enzyme maturation permease subunit